MIKPHQLKYKKKISELTNFEKIQIGHHKTLNNSASGAIVYFKSQDTLVDFINRFALSRAAAKLAYFRKCQQVAISMHIASKSTYVKARNRNKKLKRKT